MQNKAQKGPMNIGIWDLMGHTSSSNLYCYFGGHDSPPHAQGYRSLSQCTRFLLGPLFGPLKVFVVMIVALLYFKRYTSTSLVSSFIYLFFFLANYLYKSHKFEFITQNYNTSFTINTPLHIYFIL